MEYNSEADATVTNVNGTNGTDKGTEDERKVFVGGLAWQTTAKDLRGHFEKYGAIEKATLKTDSMTGESRGFGFVMFEDKASVEAVMAEPDHSLHGKKIRPGRAKPMPKPDPILKVFVGGLEPTVEEETVKSHFETFGTVVEVIFPIDKEKNERRNFAFVKFETEEIVNAVIASNNSNGKQEINGKEYDIKKSTPRPKDGGRGGFGGRGGRGGFGGGYGGYGGYGGGYGGYEDYYGGGYGGYDYSQDYYGGYGGGYGAPRGGFGKAPRARGRGRGRGFAPY